MEFQLSLTAKNILAQLLALPAEVAPGFGSLDFSGDDPVITLRELEDTGHLRIIEGMEHQGRAGIGFEPFADPLPADQRTTAMARLMAQREDD